jgi:hypothetical protein
VYPLLMLSLFSSLVGVQVIKAQQEVLDRVVSRELVVVNEEGVEVFSVVPNRNGGVRLFAGSEESDEFFEVDILAEQELETAIAQLGGADTGICQASCRYPQ